jgi:hypothetical protein
MSANPTNPAGALPRIVGAGPAEQAAQFGRHVDEIVRDLKSARASMESLILHFASQGSLLSTDDQETFKSNARVLNDAATKQEMFLNDVVACLEKDAAKVSFSPDAETTTECAHAQIALNAILGMNELFRTQMTAYAEMATRFVRDSQCASSARVSTASPAVSSGVVSAHVTPSVAAEHQPPKIESSTPQLSRPTWSDWFDEVCKSHTLATLIVGSTKAVVVNEFLSQQKHRFSRVWILTSSGVAKEKKRLLPFFDESEVCVCDFSLEALEVLVTCAESPSSKVEVTKPMAIVVRMPNAHMRESAERHVYGLFRRAIKAGLALFVTVTSAPVFSSLSANIFDSVGLTAAANVLVTDATYDAFFHMNFASKLDFAVEHATRAPVNGCMFICRHPKDDTTDFRWWHPESTASVAMAATDDELSTTSSSSTAQ